MRWNLIHVNFFVARDCNYHDEKFCDVSKADSIAWHYILLSKLRSSWRFLKFSEALHVYSNWNFYVRNMSHKKRRVKYQTEMLSRIAKQQWIFRCKQTTPWLQTPMTRNSTAIMPMDNHKQAIEKKCRDIEFERQAVRTKAMRSA